MSKVIQADCQVDAHLNGGIISEENDSQSLNTEPLADISQSSENGILSNETYNSQSSTDNNQDGTNYVSFLQSPELLWQDPDPPPEKAHSIAYNSTSTQ